MKIRTPKEMALHRAAMILASPLGQANLSPERFDELNAVLEEGLGPIFWCYTEIKEEGND